MRSVATSNGRPGATESVRKQRARASQHGARHQGEVTGTVQACDVTRFSAALLRIDRGEGGRSLSRANDATLGSSHLQSHLQQVQSEYIAIHAGSSLDNLGL